MANSLLESVPEKIAGDVPSLVDYVVAVLFKNSPSRFLKAHYVPVSGTEQALVTFEFDAAAFSIAFDFEYRAALRAMGTELPKRNNGVVGH